MSDSTQPLVTFQVFPSVDGKFAMKVNDFFIGPLPNQPGVDATGGFIGTPVDMSELPFNTVDLYDNLAEPRSIVKAWNDTAQKKGQELFGVIQSSIPDANGKPRFQISPMHPLLGLGPDWKFVYEAEIDPNAKFDPNELAGLAVWVDPAPKEDRGEAERGRPPIVPETGPST